ncbi:MAG: AI-2E family transporter, partial [Leptolyngbyaceae cyanobacterium SU_3_3]|nr:AI-2E family transporter [Leptolyngbyaceae cyanobacterium SU_3_3]
MWWRSPSQPPLLVLNAWAFSSIFHYFHSLIVIFSGGGAADVFAQLSGWLDTTTWVDHSRKGRRSSSFYLRCRFLLGLGVTLVPLAIEQAQQLVVRLP